MSLFDLTSKESKPFKIGLQIFYWTIMLGFTGLIISLAEDAGIRYYVKWAAIAFPFKLAIFYSYFYYVIPKWLYNSIGKFILITLLLFTIYPVVKYSIDQLLGVQSIQSIAVMVDEDTSGIESTTGIFIQELVRRALTVFLNIVMAFFIRFTVDWFKNLRIRQLMESQQLKSELAMLRNQVNPHFLFNTLNNIDAMVYKVSAEASEAIMKLSGIMRYMLYESNVEYVLLQKEVDYLDNYFELQKMRIKKQSALIFNCDIHDYQLKIAPMLFIPFVENAFKHADFNDLFINCTLTTNESQVVFKVKNSVPDKPLEKDGTGGIGLVNVRRRLELIYPKRHELTIDQTGKEYLVELKINIDEN